MVIKTAFQSCFLFLRHTHKSSFYFIELRCNKLSRAPVIIHERSLGSFLLHSPTKTHSTTNRSNSMQKKITLSLLTTVVTAASLFAGTASAATNPGMGQWVRGAHLWQKPAVMGTVASVSGSSLTVTDKGGITFTVDASAAKVTKGFGKNATTLTVADIKTGDTVRVMGTVSGTAVTATSISDGIGRMGQGKRGDKTRMPGAFGTVGTVNGTSFTITSPQSPKSSTTRTFTVNTDGNTVFTKDGQPATLADVTAGQKVMAVGTVDTTALTVTATKVSIMTKLPQRPARLGRANANHALNKKAFPGKRMLGKKK